MCNASPSKLLIVAAFFSFLTLLSPTLLAAEAPMAELSAVSPPQQGQALCPLSPTTGAVPMQPCKDCSQSQFSPACGVVCSFNGSCQHGSNACCNADCQCGDSTGLPGTPSNACELTLPSGCCDCPVTRFSPRFGVVCTATGSCQCDNCCEYNCACGVSSGLPGTPAEACAFDLPDGCCLDGRNLCPTHYCNGPGERCEASGCGIGCCEYTCGVPDASCTGFDPIPPEAC